MSTRMLRRYHAEQALTARSRCTRARPRVSCALLRARRSPRRRRVSSSAFGSIRAPSSSRAASRHAMARKTPFSGSTAIYTHAVLSSSGTDREAGRARASERHTHTHRAAGTHRQARPKTSRERRRCCLTHHVLGKRPQRLRDFLGVDVARALPLARIGHAVPFTL